MKKDSKQFATWKEYSGESTRVRSLVIVEILEPLNWKARLGLFLHYWGAKIFESSCSFKVIDRT
jgi:hypothetical protein